MNLFLQIIGGIAGTILLYYGAEFLVKGGVRIANIFKIPSIVIGLTLVAFATSAPELVVSIRSALSGNGNISLGNVVGSNICNIGLILGLSAMITAMNINRQILKFDLPVLGLSTVLLTLFFYLTQGINRPEAALFFIGIIAYVWKNVHDALKHPEENSLPDEVQNVQEIRLWKALLYVLVGILALVWGADLLVKFAIFIAKLLHVSDAVIGLTIVAIGTSLPELFTSCVAAYHGEKDIAVGNVIGSNIFNVLAILGIAPLIQPIQAEGIQHLDIITMCIITLLCGIMMLTGKIIRRIEGLLLLLIYTVYISLLVIQQIH